MQQDESGMRRWIGLPMAIGADLRAGLGLKKSRLGGGKARKSAPPEDSGKSHRMRIFQERRRMEFLHHNLW